MVGRLYQRTQGKLVIIGVGGISSGADAYAKIREGGRGGQGRSSSQLTAL